ncbi:hypothetical protein BLNAU_5687 [Blattamonas nauphoetae]|uniref:Methyltransferase domain-containing protein n=1 Tax=Blattamonas nauphoetae TaxID=2049346 RepID=A0ABQ9Y6Q3_9EUKA|nr:hypothetical protein BLNAU_5687 [Blattamonas nauphoetae]
MTSSSTDTLRKLDIQNTLSSLPFLTDEILDVLDAPDVQIALDRLFQRLTPEVLSKRIELNKFPKQNKASPPLSSSLSMPSPAQRSSVGYPSSTSSQSSGHGSQSPPSVHSLSHSLSSREKWEKTQREQFSSQQPTLTSPPPLAAPHIPLMPQPVMELEASEPLVNPSPKAASISPQAASISPPPQNLEQSPPMSMSRSESMRERWRLQRESEKAREAEEKAQENERKRSEAIEALRRFQEQEAARISDDSDESEEQRRLKALEGTIDPLLHPLAAQSSTIFLRGNPGLSKNGRPSIYASAAQLLQLPQIQEDSLWTFLQLWSDGKASDGDATRLLFLDSAFSPSSSPILTSLFSAYRRFYNMHCDCSVENTEISHIHLHQLRQMISTGDASSPLQTLSPHLPLSQIDCEDLTKPQLLPVLVHLLHRHSSLYNPITRKVISADARKLLNVAGTPSPLSAEEQRLFDSLLAACTPALRTIHLSSNARALLPHALPPPHAVSPLSTPAAIDPVTHTLVTIITNTLQAAQPPRPTPTREDEIEQFYSTKKTPQVAKLEDFLSSFLHLHHNPTHRNTILIDVAGGNGLFSICAALLFGVEAVVVDVNQTALQAGLGVVRQLSETSSDAHRAVAEWQQKNRAWLDEKCVTKQTGSSLAGRVHFLHCDCSTLLNFLDHPSQPSTASTSFLSFLFAHSTSIGASAPALTQQHRLCFFGLHSCGGLSDLAIRLARHTHSPFFVVPCCYNKHPSFAMVEETNTFWAIDAVLPEDTQPASAGEGERRTKTDDPTPSLVAVLEAASPALEPLAFLRRLCEMNNARNPDLFQRRARLAALLYKLAFVTECWRGMGESSKEEMWAKSRNMTEESSLFVWGLTSHTKASEIYSFFDYCGTIKSCFDIMVKTDKGPQRYIQLDFEDQSSIQIAIVLQDVVVGDSKISVSQDLPGDLKGEIISKTLVEDGDSQTPQETPKQIHSDPPQEHQPQIQTQFTVPPSNVPETKQISPTPTPPQEQKGLFSSIWNATKELGKKAVDSVQQFDERHQSSRVPRENGERKHLEIGEQVIEQKTQEFQERVEENDPIEAGVEAIATGMGKLWRGFSSWTQNATNKLFDGSRGSTSQPSTLPHQQPSSQPMETHQNSKDESVQEPSQSPSEHQDSESTPIPQQPFSIPSPSE